MTIKTVVRPKHLAILLILGLAVVAVTGPVSYILLRNGSMVGAIKSQVEKTLSQQYGVDVKIGRVAPAPFGRIRLSDLTIGEGKGASFVTVNEITIRLGLLEWVRGGYKPVAAIAEIQLVRPRLSLSRESDGQWNFSRFIKPSGGQQSAFKSRVTIRDGAVDVQGLTPSDWGVKGAAGQRKLDLSDIDGELAFTASGGLTFDLSGRVALDPQARISVSGLVSPSTGAGSAVRARLWLRGVDFARDAAYLPQGVNVGRISRGTGDIRLDVARANATAPFEISGETTFHSVDWKSPWVKTTVRAADGRVAFNADGIAIQQLSADLLGTRVQVSGRVTSPRSPVLDLNVKAESASLADVAALLGTSGGERSFGGRVSVDANIKGDWRKPMVDGTARFTDGTLLLPGLEVPLTDVSGEVKLAGRSFSTNGLLASYAGSRIKVSGLVRAYGRPEGDLRVQVDGLPSTEALRLAQGLAGEKAADQLAAFEHSVGEVGGRLFGDVNLRGPLTSPVVSGKIGLNDARFDDLTIPEAQADFSYAEGSLAVSKLEGTVGTGKVNGSFSIAGLMSAQPDYAFQLQLDGLDLAGALAALHAQAPMAVAGSVKGSVTGSGSGRSLSGLKATASVEVADARLGRETLAQARMAGTWDHGSVTLDYVSLASDSGEVLVQGQADAAGQLNGSISGHGLDIAELTQNLELSKYWPQLSKVQVGGKVDLFATLGGTRQQPEIAGEVRLANPRYRDASFRYGEGNFTYKAKTLNLEGLSLRTGEAEHQVNGSVHFGASPTLDLTVTSKSAGMADLLRLAGVKADLSGSVDGDFTVKGALNNPSIDGHAQVTRGSVAGQPFDQGEATFVLADHKLEVEQFTAKAGTMEIKGRGQVTDGNLDFFLDAQDLDLGQLVFAQRAGAGLAGTGSFTGTITGKVTDPVVEGEVKGRDFAYAGYAASKLEGSIKYADDKVTLTNVDVEMDKDKYSVSGDITLRPTLSLDLRTRVDNGSIEDLVRLSKAELPFALSGDISGVLRIWGEPSNPSGRLIAESSHAQLGGIDLAGDIDVGLRNGEYTINRLRLTQGQGLFVAVGKVSRDRTFDLRAHGKGLDIAPWLTTFNVPVSASGQAEVDLTLAGSLADPRGNATVKVSSGMMNGVAVDSLAAEATLADHKINLENLVLTSGGHSLTAAGTLPWPARFAKAAGVVGDAGRYDLQVRMTDGDFSLLSFLGKSLTLAGKGDIALDVTGPASAPSVTGTVVARGVSVLHPGLRGQIEGLEGRFDFRGDRIEFSNVTAKYNGGPTTAKGTIQWPNGKPQLDLTLSARDIHYENPVLDAVISADLTVKGPLLTPEIRGQGTLDKATLTLGTKTVRGTSPFDPRLDIAVSSREDVRVMTRAKSLDVRAYGNLQIKGTLKNPAFTGEAEASRGTFVYLDTPFQVTSGTADFAAYRGILPRLDVQAETTVEAPGTKSDATDTVKISLGITGVLPQLTMSLTSDPPMSQAEINGLLSLPGQISRLVTSGDRQGSLQSEVARLVDTQLSNQVMGGLQNAVEEALQLDEFKLDSSFTEKNMSMQLGKYLVDNLYMTYTRTLTTEPEETIRFEYRMKPGLMLNTSLNNKGEMQWGLEAKKRF